MVVVVMMMVVMVMMRMMRMMMMVVVMMLGHGSRGGRRSGFLRDGVTGEAEREHGGCGEGLDHDTISFG